MSIVKEKRDLPDYDGPPVTEVVIGVQFERLKKFSAIHPGLYWPRIKDNYPKFEPHALLVGRAESFDGFKPGIRELEFSDMPPVPRCWFLEGAGNRLVQVQADRFLHNWRKVTGDEVYPRYEGIRAEFVKLWADFLEFTEEQQLGQVDTNYWEVTYVNHLEKGREWDVLGDLDKIFPCWAGKSSEGYLPEPENVGLRLSFVMAEQSRLHISIDRALRSSDKKEVLLFKLTARGILESSDQESLVRGLDSGREWIVRGFTDFTSKSAHDMWKRKDG